MALRSDDGLVGQAEDEQEIFPQLGRTRVELITKEEERNVWFFRSCLGKVGGIIRSSSALELEDSDDNSTNGEGHAQGPEHEAIHPAL